MWDGNVPMQTHELAELFGISRRTAERRLVNCECANPTTRGSRPRRGVTFLPSVASPYLHNGQPHRRLGPTEDEVHVMLAQEAS